MVDDKYYYDIKRLINEIIDCYHNELFFAAIELALTLPDVCCKIEYDVKPKTEGYFYTKWCKEWLSEYMISSTKMFQTDDLWADALYQTRCGVLHNAENDYNKKSNEFVELREFNFYINENVRSFHEDALYIEEEQYTGLCRNIDKSNFKININVGYFIFMITEGVKKFIISRDMKVDDFPILKIQNK